MELFEAAFVALAVLLVLAFVGGGGYIIWRMWSEMKPADGTDIDPAGAGGPRPKPAGTDMEAQASGGPRPKV